MKTNDLKKGDKFRLRNGWEAKMEDNGRGNVRFATVYGFVTEMGSVYGYDIVTALTDDGEVAIEHTPAQLKNKALNESVGF